ncbi:MAG: hypothetical protein LBO77_01685 [Desulfovibrio sp.]|nr:hypothetical protein [Desulfovibrio sp.]
MDPYLLADMLLLPLARLILAMSLGLLLACMLDALRWTSLVAGLVRPLARLGRLGEAAGASFALAFFSPSAANALLAEAHARGAISRREVILANIFNSSPSYLVHLPSVFSLLFAFLGFQALTYVGLTFLAASLRTLGTLAAARLLLPPVEGAAAPARAGPEREKEPFAGILRRFRKRLFRLLTCTVPLYCAVFAMQQAGWFKAAQAFMAENSSFLAFLDPAALGIAALGLSGEMNLALSAAAPLLESGFLSHQEVILALLAGNILSSPMRAFRHQFPAYAGYFRPRLAALLVGISQACRMASLTLAAALYYFCGDFP